MNDLVDGKIPKGNICPWRNQCSIADSGNCHHKGENHDVDFSCASARSFEIAGVMPDHIKGIFK